MRKSKHSDCNDPLTAQQVRELRPTPVRRFERTPIEHDTVHLHVPSLEGDVFGQVLLSLDNIGETGVGAATRLQRRLQITAGPVDELSLAT